MKLIRFGESGAEKPGVLDARASGAICRRSLRMWQRSSRWTK